MNEDKTVEVPVDAVKDLIQAANRLIRFVRINEKSDGGLLTRETSEAIALLEAQASRWNSLRRG